jgi:hypothetical protein
MDELLGRALERPVYGAMCGCYPGITAVGLNHPTYYVLHCTQTDSNIVVYYVACDAYSYGTTLRTALLHIRIYYVCVRMIQQGRGRRAYVHNQRGCGPSQCTPHMLWHRVGGLHIKVQLYYVRRSVFKLFFYSILVATNTEWDLQRVARAGYTIGRA